MANLPKCGGCKKQYNSPCPGVENRAPLLLRCGHTFCKRCLLKWASKRNYFICPICGTRSEWPNGRESVNMLWPNVYYAGVIASGSAIPSLSKYFSQIDHVACASNSNKKECRTTKCSECIVSVATCRCIHCLVDMCDKCFASVHAHARLLQHHKKVPLRSSLTNTECIEHRRLLEFYCEEDKQPICPECMISPNHKGHNIVRMVSKYDAYKKDIIDAISKAKSSLAFSGKVKSRIEAELHKIKVDAYKQAEAVYWYFLDCVSKLEISFLEIIKELEDCAESSCDELIGHLQGIEANEITVKDACSDAELVTSDNTMMKIVVDPEKLLSTLRSYKLLPYDIQKTSNFATDELQKKIALRSEFFQFVPSPEMLKLFEKFGKITVTKGCVYKIGKIESCITILDALPQKNVEPKPKPPSILKLQEPYSKSRELVSVKFVETPTEFTVQRWSDRSHVESINRCLKHMKIRKPSLNDSFKSIAIGELCAANYDRDGQFYRAVVIKKIEQGEETGTSLTADDWTGSGVERVVANDIVEVRFIDYGNTTMTQVKALRRLPEELKQLPGLSITCSLGNICPVNGARWTTEAKKYFAKIANRCPMLMSTLKREKGTRYVDLQRPAAGEIDGDIPISIRDALVFLGFAKFQVQPVSSDRFQSAGKRFLTPVPLSLNSLISVTVSKLCSPSSFSVQQSGGHLAHLGDMVKKIQVWVKKHMTGKHNADFRDAVHDLQIISPMTGMICLAHFAADNQWYRARILEVNKDRTVKVEYVDYGNINTILFSKLIKIPEVFTRLPAQALSCKLYNIKPLLDEDVFSPLCIKRMAELCYNNELIMEVRDIKGENYYVDLFDSSDEDPTIVSISDRLYRESLVKYEKDSGAREIAASHANSREIQAAEPEHVQSSEKSDSPPKIRARVTHVISPALFYLQTETQTNDLNVMMHALQEKMENYNLEDRAKSFEVGLTYAVHSKREKRWCRGKLDFIAIEGEESRVTMIDFGWQELVSLSDLRKLPEDIVVVKVFVSQCCLGCVTPAGGSSNWTSTAIDCFKELVSGKECLADISPGNGDGSLVVDVFTGNQEFGHLEEEDSHLTQISKALILQGLALPFKGPATNDASKLAIGRNSDSFGKDEEKSPDYTSDSMSGFGDKGILFIENCDSESGDELANREVPEKAIIKAVPEGGDELNMEKDGTCFADATPYPSITVLNAATTMSCSVSHVHNHQIFYIRRNYTVGESEDVSSLINETFDWKMSMNEVQNLKDESPISLTDIVKMLPCLCLYEADQRLHRAVVLSTDLLPESVLVQYIDFGTLEEVAPHNLRPIPNSLRMLPVQSFLCRLVDHSGDHELCGDGGNLTRRFGRIVQGQYLSAEIRGVEEPSCEFIHCLRCYVVSLYFEWGEKVQLVT